MMKQTVNVHGHQYFAVGKLESVGFNPDGPVALVWLGSKLNSFQLHGSKTSGATFWIEETEPLDGLIALPVVDCMKDEK